jgi:hypothetical protein
MEGGIGMDEHKLSGEVIHQLSEIEGEWCLTFVLPTRPVGGEWKGDRIQLKNLSAQAEERLINAGLRAPEALELLKPAEALLDEREFWQQGSQGLAIYITPEETFYVRLRHSPEPASFVSGHPQVRPLLIDQQQEQSFFVLAISKAGNRFFAVDMEQVIPIVLEGAPSDMAEALAFDDPERQLQLHTSDRAERASKPVMFHGHGAGVNDDLSNLRRYLQQVAAPVEQRLLGTGDALVLAGVDEVTSEFNDLLAAGIRVIGRIGGNPDLLDPRQLAEHARELVASTRDDRAAQAVQRYLNARSIEGQTENSIQRVMTAARYGQVDTLLLDRNRHFWGDYSEDGIKLGDGTGQSPPTEDLMNLAAIYTLQSNGQVYSVEADSMPGNDLIAALLRYAESEG